MWQSVLEFLHKPRGEVVFQAPDEAPEGEALPSHLFPLVMGDAVQIPNLILIIINSSYVLPRVRAIERVQLPQRPFPSSPPRRVVATGWYACCCSGLRNRPLSSLVIGVSISFWATFLRGPSADAFF